EVSAHTGDSRQRSVALTSAPNAIRAADRPSAAFSFPPGDSGVIQPRESVLLVAVSMTLPLGYRDVPDSPLARWDARWKLAALVLAAFGMAALNRWIPSLAALLLGLALVVLARLPRPWVRGRLGL